MMPWQHKGLRRFVKFGIVGGSGVIVNLAIFRLILWIFGTTEFQIFVANLAGVIVSIFTNFLLNDVWTWGDREKGEGRWWNRLLKYYLTASVAAGVQLIVTSGSYALLWKFLDLRLGELNVSPDLALLTGIACGMGINFVVSHVWTFKDA